MLPNSRIRNFLVHVCIFGRRGQRQIQLAHFGTLRRLRRDEHGGGAVRLPGIRFILRLFLEYGPVLFSFARLRPLVRRFLTNTVWNWSWFCRPESFIRVALRGKAWGLLRTVLRCGGEDRGLRQCSLRAGPLFRPFMPRSSPLLCGSCSYLPLTSCSGERARIGHRQQTANAATDACEQALPLPRYARPVDPKRRGRRVGRRLACTSLGACHAPCPPRTWALRF
jgi:hypothetical protein